MCQRLAPGGLLVLIVPLTFFGLTLLLWGLVGGPKLESRLSLHGSLSYWQTPCACVAASFLLSWGLYFALRGCIHGQLVFVHIPKNAGTSVELAGIVSGINWGSMHLHFAGYQKMPDGNTCSRYHVPPRHLHGPNPYSSGNLFCLVRNPFDRAVSEYKYLLTANWGQQYSETFSTGLFEHPRCSTEGLNHFVESALKSYRKGSRYIDDCHHVPQVEFVYGEDGSQLCNDVLRFEELPLAFDNLMQEHGYPVRLGSFRDGDSSATCKNLSSSDFSAETRQLILEVYKDDFRLLNYSTTM